MRDGRPLPPRGVDHIFPDGEPGDLPRLPARGVVLLAANVSAGLCDAHDARRLPPPRELSLPVVFLPGVGQLLLARDGHAGGAANGDAV